MKKPDQKPGESASSAPFPALRDGRGEEGERAGGGPQEPSGLGDRSERIRTYNFPQNRLTDHRINLTLYKLDLIMAGNLDEVIEPLKIASGEAALAEA